MATQAADPTTTGPNFTSAEYAEQWRRGKKLRGEASEAVTEMMLDLANIQVGPRTRARCWHGRSCRHDRTARRSEWIRVGHGHFCRHAEPSG
jgi:hypothetical protein